MIKIIVTLFTIFVLIYIITVYKKLNIYDFIIFFISLTILLVLLFKKNKPKEHFSQTDNPISLIDDLDILNPIAASYISVYTPTSYNASLGNFNDIINNKIIYNLSIPNTNITDFSKNGVPLNSSILTGPSADSLNINYESQYSIMFVCKFGNFVTPNAQRIELFRLNANCLTTNVGISLYIDKNSITQVGPIFKGDLILQYGDTSDTPCVLIQNNNSQFIFDPNNLTYFFITRGTDSITVSYMTEKISTKKLLANLTLTNTGITFANVPLQINYYQNLTGNLYSFGIFNISLNDTQISDIYNNINNLYKIYDSGADNYVDQYQNLKSKHNTIGSCPFDKNTCSKCSTVETWNDISQIIGSPSECKKYVNDACASDPNISSICMCWNSAHNIYNSTSCKLYRSIFTSPDEFLRNLSTDNLNVIRDKYGLLLASDCPKDIKPLEPHAMQFNDIYNYDKVKLNYSLSNPPKSIEIGNQKQKTQISKPEYEIQVQNTKDNIISPSQFKNTPVIQKNDINSTVLNTTDKIYTPDDIKSLANTYNNNISSQPYYENENNNTNILSKISSYFI